MMRRKHIFKVSALIVAFLFLSCKSKETVVEKLVGQWEIREITYNGVNYKNDLYVNFMVFEKSHQLLIPQSIHFEKDYLATWDTVTSTNELKLSLKCVDEVFKGTYQLKFIKNYQEKLLGIEMTSDSTKIKAFKFFQDFSAHEKSW